ncbi:helix-turn-helix domain-containing protein [Paenibacillus sp. MMO-177]|uniref:helix-turn-helix domain-containing protein n=1 Tax=Paenibacillus sp. MMO-177 TaxID=3081289 RepID=UPI003017D988
MKQPKADLILHPIRMRIIQAFLPEGSRTTQQLAEQLPNIPQATLYRHLNILRQAGLIHVIEERKNRGSVEKVYSLAKQAEDLTPEELTEKSSDQHMELFMKFVASLIGDFGAYIGQEHYHLAEDGVSFRQVQLYMNDEEYQAFLTAYRAQMKPYANAGPSEGRKLRMISTIVIPEALQQPFDKK